jgi:hypothetical protein
VVQEWDLEGEDGSGVPLDAEAINREVPGEMQIGVWHAIRGDLYPNLTKTRNSTAS